MKLEKILSKKKATISKRWLESIIHTYPSDTQRFLKKKSDQFGNPVGYTIYNETENLIHELLDRGDIDPERVSPILDKLIRVWAIQDFSPSHTITLLLHLKKIIIKELKKDIADNNLYEELILFYDKIDQVVLIAFDIFSKCRETLYEIQVRQAKSQVSGLLRKAGLFDETPEWNSHQKDGNIIDHEVIT